MDAWQEDVAAFVEARLPAAPARVLELGCGSGWLCHHLAGVGYEARGVDPQAPDDPILHQVAWEDFDPPMAVEAVVAVLSLHHVGDLAGAVDKLADVLAPDGTLVLVEFAWDRFDDRTALWCLDRLPPESDEHNWLHHRLAPLRERHSRGEPLRIDEVYRAWAAEEGMHSSVEMRSALRRRFSERSFEAAPYLYPDLEGVAKDEEQSAILDGEIEPTGFRVVASALR